MLPQVTTASSMRLSDILTADRILIENTSTNTGENVQFTRSVIAAVVSWIRPKTKCGVAVARSSATSSTYCIGSLRT